MPGASRRRVLFCPVQDRPRIGGKAPTIHSSSYVTVFLVVNTDHDN